jgi:hypothetical protein
VDDPAMNCSVCLQPLHCIEENANIDEDLWCYECLTCGIDYDVRNGLIKQWAIGHYNSGGIEMNALVDDAPADDQGVQIVNSKYEVLYQCDWSLPTKELLDLFDKYVLLQ